MLVVRSRRALRRLLWHPGELGLARAYVTGDIDVEGDLTDGLQRAWRLARPHPDTALSKRGRMVAALRGVRLGALGPPPRAPTSEARLSGRLHTRRRDRAAIAHHYDLSNDFYRLLLDDHMAYSAAYFTQRGQSLHDAQTAKLDLICRKRAARRTGRPGVAVVSCRWQAGLSRKAGWAWIRSWQQSPPRPVDEFLVWRKSIWVNPESGSLQNTTRRSSCPSVTARRWALPAGSI